MMMVALSYASLATIHGLFYPIFYDKSKTCINGNTENNCLTCETDKFRIFNPNENSCLCNIGFYDNEQSEICQQCHYSWYNYFFMLYLVIPVLKKQKKVAPHAMQSFFVC